MADFQSYITKIRRLYDEVDRFRQIYEKRKESQKAFAASPSTISDNLAKCYKRIPPAFLAISFAHETILSKAKNRETIFKAQSDLTNILDEVQLNLCFQITDQFHNFLQVLNNLTHLDDRINDTSLLLKENKLKNAALRQGLAAPSERIFHLKMKEMNIKRALKHLELMKVIHKTLPTLDELINANGFEYASSLVRNAERNFSQKLKGVKCFSRIEATFNGAKTTLETQLVNDFMAKSIEYLVPQFSLSKVDQSEDKSSFEHGDLRGILKDLEINEAPLVLPWTVIELEQDEDAEKRMAKIVLETLKVRSFSPRILKNKLKETLKSFYKGVFEEVSEFLMAEMNQENQKSPTSSPVNHQKPKGNSLESLIPKAGVKFQMEIMLILFKLAHFGLSRAGIFIKNIILVLLLDFDSSNLTQSPIGPVLFGQKPNENGISGAAAALAVDSSVKVISEVIDEFAEVLKDIHSLAVGKITEMIEFRRPETLNLPGFHAVLLFLKKALHSLEKTRIEKFGMVFPRKNQKPQTVDVLVTRYNKLIEEKLSGETLKFFLGEYERIYFKSFEKEAIETVKSSVENETWKSTPVPFEFHSILRFIMFPDTHLESSLNTTRIIYDELKELNPTLMKWEPLEVDSSKVILPFLKEKSMGSEIKIEKNEIHVLGKKYVMIRSFLITIKVIFDCLYSAFILGSLRFDCLKTIQSIGQVYTKLSNEMTIKLGAKKAKKVQKITSKHLALNVVALKFLLTITANVFNFLDRGVSLTQDQKAEVNRCLAASMFDIQKHINYLLDKLVSIMESRYSRLCLDHQNYRIVFKYFDLNTASRAFVPSSKTQNGMMRLLSSLAQQTRPPN